MRMRMVALCKQCPGVLMGVRSFCWRLVAAELHVTAGNSGYTLVKAAVDDAADFVGMRCVSEFVH